MQMRSYLQRPEVREGGFAVGGWHRTIHSSHHGFECYGGVAKVELDGMLIHAKEVRPCRVASGRRSFWQVVQTEWLPGHQNSQTRTRFDVIDDCGAWSGSLCCCSVHCGH